MEFNLSSDLLTIVSDKKTITLTPSSLLSVDGMEIELPGEYEKAGFLIQSRYLSSPFDPIAVAHKALQKQIKKQQAEEIGEHEEDTEDVENESQTDTIDEVEESVILDPQQPDQALSTPRMIHSLNLEGYNILLVSGDFPLKLLKDEYLSSFIKKVDLIATDGGEGSVDLIQLVEPRVTLVHGSHASVVMTKLGKMVESTQKWKSREADFQSDEGVFVMLSE